MEKARKKNHIVHDLWFSLLVSHVLHTSLDSYVIRKINPAPFKITYQSVCNHLCLLDLPFTLSSREQVTFRLDGDAYFVLDQHAHWVGFL
jgi:hypothetical protein